MNRAARWVERIAVLFATIVTRSSMNVKETAAHGYVGGGRFAKIGWAGEPAANCRSQDLMATAESRPRA
jgi:hypothetical protein